MSIDMDAPVSPPQLVSRKHGPSKKKAALLGPGPGLKKMNAVSWYVENGKLRASKLL